MSHKNHLPNRLFGYLQEGETRGYNEKDDSFLIIANSGQIDRTGEIVEIKGIDTSRYRQNPVILPSHQWYGKAIGRSLWEKKTNDGLLLKIQFADTEEGRDYKYLYMNGFMSAFSIGFDPKERETRKVKGQDVRVHTKSELLEVSCVAVPADPHALMREYESGNIKSACIKGMIDEIMQEEDMATVKEMCEKIESMTSLIETLTEKVNGICASLEQKSQEQGEEPPAAEPDPQEAGPSQEDLDKIAKAQKILSDMADSVNLIKRSRGIV